MPRAATPAELTAAQQSLVAAHARYADWYVRHKAPAALVAAFGEHDDAVQAALLGMIRAAQVYDPARGAPFPAFAEEWMRLALFHEARREPLIYVPPHAQAELGFALPTERIGAVSAERLTARHDGPAAVDRQDEIDALLRRHVCVEDRPAMRLLFAGYREYEAAEALGEHRQRVHQRINRATARLLKARASA